MDETEEIIALWLAMYGDDGHIPYVSVRSMCGVFTASVRASGNPNESAAHGCDALASRVALRDKLRGLARAAIAKHAGKITTLSGTLGVSQQIAPPAIGSMWCYRGRSTCTVERVNGDLVYLDFSGCAVELDPFELRSFYELLKPEPQEVGPSASTGTTEP